MKTVYSSLISTINSFFRFKTAHMGAGIGQTDTHTYDQKHTLSLDNTASSNRQTLVATIRPNKLIKGSSSNFKRGLKHWRMSVIVRDDIGSFVWTTAYYRPEAQKCSQIITHPGRAASKGVCVCVCARVQCKGGHLEKHDNETLFQECPVRRVGDKEKRQIWLQIQSPSWHDTRPTPTKGMIVYSTCITLLVQQRDIMHNYYVCALNNHWCICRQREGRRLNGCHGN